MFLASDCRHRKPDAIMSFNAATGHLKHSLKPKANELVSLFLNFGRHRKRRRLGPFFSHLASRIITPHFVDAVSCVCSASACLIFARPIACPAVAGAPPRQSPLLCCRQIRRLLRRQHQAAAVCVTGRSAVCSKGEKGAGHVMKLQCCFYDSP